MIRPASDPEIGHGPAPRGKRALVTGGSRGIGCATALLLAEEGCDLVLVARDPDALVEAAIAARSRGQVGVETLARTSPAPTRSSALRAPRAPAGHSTSW